MENENNEVKEVAIPIPNKEVVLAGDPEKQFDYAVKSANILVKVLNHPNKKKVMIKGQQFLTFEDWQTLARFYGATVGNEWTKPLMREGKLIGYEARSNVFMKGEIISSAEAMCTVDEKNWDDKDEFTLRSMAQTRANSKALRNVFSWVAVLGGLNISPTPEEEMPVSIPRTYVPNTPVSKIPNAVNKTALDSALSKEKAGIVYMTEEESTALRDNKSPIVPTEYADYPEAQGEEMTIEPIVEKDNVAPWNKPQPQGECATWNCPEKITDKVRAYSLEHYGKVLCYKHQKDEARIK